MQMSVQFSADAILIQSRGVHSVQRLEKSISQANQIEHEKVKEKLTFFVGYLPELNQAYLEDHRV